MTQSNLEDSSKCKDPCPQNPNSSQVPSDYEEECPETPIPSYDSDDCPKPPDPESWDLPEKPNCQQDYKGIDPDERKKICFTRRKAENDADLQYKQSIVDAEDALMEAETAFKKAERKYGSDKDKLDDQIKFEKEKLLLDYTECINTYFPKKCPPGTGKIACYNKAICLAKFELDLAAKDKEYVIKIQAINKEKSSAENVWKIAQKDYMDKRCLAAAIQKEAYCKAIHDWRKTLADALKRV